MEALTAAFVGLGDFLDKGGDVLWAILALAIWLWWLMLERYWYFTREHRPLLHGYREQWGKRKEYRSWYAQRQRRQLLAEIDCAMHKNLQLIPTLIALLPMFGLMGTVTGMIQVFDVMALMGSGNPRAMADGVSAATIPTMAGMVVALVAIPFATALERRYKRELREANAAFTQTG
ncbi:MotA/TolQ/ExbB proton channel family protein [Microbulbifer rhizosphaerae]|uniref:Biopolymer transport protein ExbB n=1 Tax=Microbulbifer rhizosphaerae TaxID=1562603 RepID=A0A7W4WFL4_9GAMM|nr:MotA/TolQ/ExbB proton channel family protein [Microbulbifer rhizosphaerae]MBB3062887.1 biopolymer transport protein ExbB [Microbulbifer rhizosphaerae]